MEYRIWKQKLVKSYLNKTSVFDKTWKQTSVFITRLQNKICLKGYKIMSVWREGLPDYKREGGLQESF